MPLKPITLEGLNRIAALVIGPAGIGKTCLTRSLLGQRFDDATRQWVQAEEPRHKVCVLSAEAGLLSVRDLVADGLLTGYEISSYDEMREAYHLLAHDAGHREHFDWIVIDSLTEIAQRCEEKAKADNPGAGDKFKLWGQYSDDLTEIVKKFRDMTRYSVLFTCLPEVEKDENGRRFIGAALAGKKIKERLTSYFDLVFYLDAFAGDDGQSRRLLLTQPWERMPAKDRSGKLAWLEEPNMLAIERKILGPASAPAQAA